MREKITKVSKGVEKYFFILLHDLRFLVTLLWVVQKEDLESLPPHKPSEIPIPYLAAKRRTKAFRRRYFIPTNPRESREVISNLFYADRRSGNLRTEDSNWRRQIIIIIKRAVCTPLSTKNESPPNQHEYTHFTTIFTSLYTEDKVGK